MQDQSGASTHVDRRRRGRARTTTCSTGSRSPTCRTASSTNPSSEMVEDVRVQVHTYDAEMGRTGGGVFNTSARSGSESVPRIGLLPEPSERARRSELLQRDSRHPDRGSVSGATAAAAFGGPIIRSKTFFWAAGEGYRDGQSQNNNLHVPTRAMRNGDFSGLTDSAGPPDHHLRSADDRRQRQSPAIPGQHHSRQSHQHGRPQPRQRAAAAR